MTATPPIHIDSVRKIYDDGAHNAFTDLCRFDGMLYLTFRSSPTGHHVVSDSSIVILRSPDGEAWEKVHTFNVPDRDVRDPHFLVFRDTLFVYTGTWMCHPSRPDERDINEQLGYAAWSQDGEAWEGPRALEGTYGHYIWRAAAFRDTAYLCGRRTRDFVPQDHPDLTKVIREAALLASADGFVWTWRSLFHATKGNETAFFFEDDGELVAVVRDKEDSTLCRAQPPYTAWHRAGLGRYIGGPLIARWGERTLIAGRKFLQPGEGRTVLSWLANDELVDIAELPSGGDTSYPGFIELSPDKGLLSYYSSHEGSGKSVAPCSIYLAELVLGQ